MNRAAQRLLRRMEVPHGREKERGAHLARGNVRGLCTHLGHPECVLAAIETIEGGGIAIELVAEDDDEMAHSQGMAR